MQGSDQTRGEDEDEGGQVRPQKAAGLEPPGLDTEARSVGIPWQRVVHSADSPPSRAAGYNEFHNKRRTGRRRKRRGKGGG